MQSEWSSNTLSRTSRPSDDFLSVMSSELRCFATFLFWHLGTASGLKSRRCQISAGADSRRAR